MTHLRLHSGARIPAASVVSFIIGVVPGPGRARGHGCGLSHRVSAPPCPGARPGCNDVTMLSAVSTVTNGAQQAVQPRAEQAVTEHGGPLARRLLVISHPAIVS